MSECESLNQVLIDVVKALGGSKRVRHRLCLKRPLKQRSTTC